MARPDGTGRSRRGPGAAGALAGIALVAACGSPAPPVGPFVGSSATVVTRAIAFDPDEVRLPAGTPLRIVLDNQDAGVPHDVKVISGDRELGKSAIVTGPAQAEVRFGPLAAGSYQFTCEVHPNMVGTLTVAEP